MTMLHNTRPSGAAGRNGTSALWYGLYPGAYVAERHDERAELLRGRGCHVQDGGGRWLLDARAGLRTVTLGYDHPAVVEAIARQAAELPFSPSVLYDRPARICFEYAERLVAAMPDGAEHVRFGNTGSQMTDASLLLSRYIRRLAGEQDRTEVVAFTGGFHGSGAGACALTGAPFLHEWFGPLAPGVHHVDQLDGDAAPLAGAIERVGPERVTALYVEPVVQSSLNVMSPELAAEIGALCDRWDIHLVVDEVSTGFGRAGAMTRSEQIGLRPDMLVVSKGMTSGYVPAAALFVDEPIYGAIHDSPFPGFPVASTTDGHPLAMAAGLAVLEAYERERVLDNVAARSRELGERLEALARGSDLVADVRGVGLLWLVELRRDGAHLPFETVEALRRAVEDRGVLVGSDAAGIGLYPPLVVTAEEVTQIVDALADALHTGVPGL